MQADPLDGCIAKIERAKLHLDEIKDRVKTEQPFGFSWEIDYEAQEVVVHARSDRATSVRWGVIAGEIIHQLRSSLDHVVRQLVIANDHEPEERRTAFPVFWEEDKYQSRGRRMINGVSDAAATIIEGLQPFGSVHATDPLHVLDELWNRDKHRLLNIAIANVHGLQLTALTPNGPRGLMIELNAPYEDGAEICRRPLPFALTTDVSVTGQVLVTFQFAEAGPATGCAFPSYLAELTEFTERVISELAATVSSE